MEPTDPPPTMLAAVSHGDDGGVDPTTVPIPTPGRGEVLIRMAASPVNPSDLAYLRGHGRVATPPLVGGTEGSGVVIGSGGGVLARALTGRRVAFATRREGALGTGAWSELVVAPAARCLPLPRGLDLVAGAAAFVNPLTALALLEIARSGRHESVVLSAAAGALGRMLIRTFAAAGVATIAVVRRAEQEGVVLEEGATAVVVARGESLVEALHPAVTRYRPRIAFDAVGGTTTGALLSALQPGGTVVLYGSLQEEATVLDPRTVVFGERRVRGFFLPRYLKERGTVASVRLALRARSQLGGRLATRVGALVPLARADEAVRLAAAGTSGGKVLIVGDERFR